MPKYIEVEELESLVLHEIDDCVEELVNADDELTKALTCTMAGANRVVTIAKNMPSIEIVRCKDCKYNYGIAHNCEFAKSDIVCTLWESDGFDESDYCSRGERKETDA